MTMALTKCRYCDHGNPPDSRYCNSCGATLTLAPCPHCGAVNDVAATTCYQCRGNLQEASADAPAAALPATVASSAPATRRPSRAVVGAVVAAIVAVAGYYTYRQSATVVPPPTAAANTEAKGRVDSATPAPIAGAAAPVTGTAAFAVAPAGTATTPPVPSPTPQIIQRRTGGEPAARPEAASVAAAVARPRTADAGRAGEAPPPRIGPCTERVAALGLCTPGLIPNREAETATAAVPAAARPQANNDGKPCTEAVAALGLCTK